jgi:hypothetical protein
VRSCEKFKKLPLPNKLWDGRRGEETQLDLCRIAKARKWPVSWVYGSQVKNGF